MPTSILTMVSLPLASGGSDGTISDPDLALWTFIVFGILLVILYVFAWGPICEALDAREEAIQADLDSARVNAEKSEQAQRELDAKLAEAASTANKIVSDAKDEAEKAKERIINEGNAEAKRLVDRGMSDIESAKKAAVATLAQSSVDNAVGLAGKMIGKTLDKDSHAELIQSSLDKFAGQS